jgi:RNA polymerase sigma factor (TIGR02999 family)
MPDVTSILNAIERGDRAAAAQLWPLVYDELRRLAGQLIAHERPGQTLDATALVHEAYLRLAGAGGDGWANRRHFFAACAEAMRRILIDRARARQAEKRGQCERIAVELEQLAARYSDEEMLAVDSLLDGLARTDADAAELARLHVFGGLSIEEAGAALGMARATAYRNWSFARAWLRSALDPS